MARPKIDTPEGKEAIRKWRETMKERHGDVNDFFSRIGKKGGMNGKGENYKGGFAGNPELAKIAGKKGGMKSRKQKSYKKLWEEKYSL